MAERKLEIASTLCPDVKNFHDTNPVKVTLLVPTVNGVRDGLIEVACPFNIAGKCAAIEPHRIDLISEKAAYEYTPENFRKKHSSMLECIQQNPF